MAVMARTLGIPSRIAVGYAPGSVVNVKDGQNQYEATSDDLHAWTEIYFTGVGWVSFEPTPGVGSATSFKEPGVPSSNTDSSTNQGSDRQSVRDETGPIQDTTSTSSTASRTAPRTALTVLAGLLLLLGVPRVVRLLRRRWHTSRAGSSVDPVWRELEDTARDYGVPFSVSDTPRGFAARLVERPGVDQESLDRLLHRVERARFARDARQDGDGVDDLRAVIASVGDGATRQERWRAVWLPRSLAGRRAYSVAPPRPASALG
jgi:hypothetical protein